MRLGLLLVIATCQILAWIVLVPPFQGPDEDTHLSYVQRMVEEQRIPWKPGGDPEPGVKYSNELDTALADAGLGTLIGNLGARPYWTSADVARWERDQDAFTSADRRGGVFTSSLKNPPGYYAYAALPYTVGKGGSIFDRLMLMRLAQIPLFLATVVFAWLMIGELIGRGWPQVVGAGAVALVPQLSNVATGVGPDILTIALSSAILWLSLLVLRRGPERRLLVWLALACGAGLVTHSRMLPLLVPAALAVFFAFARGRIRPLYAFGVGAVGYCGLLTVWTEIGKGSIREFVSYLWQFYLPKLGFMTPTIGPDDYGFREAYVDRFYGTLAWLEVTLPSTLEQVLWWVSLAALVALAVVLVRRRAAIRGEEAATFGLAIIALLFGLHVAAYRALQHDPDPIVTARYLLPLLPLFGVAVALLVRELPRRLVGVGIGLVLAAGAALQFTSLGLLLERFYA